jgi:hypothetical protein
MQLHGAELSAVPVRVVALAKSQLVWVRMRPEVNSPVAQETPHRPSTALVLVDDQHQSVKLGGRVQAVGLVVRLAVSDVPQLQVAASSLHARRPEVQLGCPVSAVVHRVVCPQRAALAAGIRGCEDDAVGEDLGRVVVDAQDSEVRDPAHVGGHVAAVLVAEAEVVDDILGARRRDSERRPGHGLEGPRGDVHGAGGAPESLCPVSGSAGVAGLPEVAMSSLYLGSAPRSEIMRRVCRSAVLWTAGVLVSDNLPRWRWSVRELAAHARGQRSVSRVAGPRQDGSEMLDMSG